MKSTKEDFTIKNYKTQKFEIDLAIQHNTTSITLVMKKIYKEWNRIFVKHK